MLFQYDQNNGTNGFDPSELPIDLFWALIIIAIASVSGIFLLKLGLRIVKAEKRTKLKTVAFYYLFLLGTIFIINAQNFFMGMEGGPDFFFIFFFGGLSLFITTNMANIIFDLGIKKAIVVSIFIVIPISIAMSILMQTIGSMMGGPPPDSYGPSISLLQSFV